MRPEKKKILFVLSDGYPGHSVDEYIAYKGILDTRKAVAEAIRGKTIVVGLHFGDQPSEEHKIMYPNLVYSKIESLPVVLGATLKRALSKSCS